MPAENQAVCPRSSAEAAHFWDKLRDDEAITESLRPKSICNETTVQVNRPVLQEQQNLTLFQRQMKPWDLMPEYKSENNVGRVCTTVCTSRSIERAVLRQGIHEGEDQVKQLQSEVQKLKLQQKQLLKINAGLARYIHDNS
jgi:hypothetical protein